MKVLRLITILFIFPFCLLNAQRSFLSYYDLRTYQQASPGAFKFGLYSYDNPAMTTYLHDVDIMFSLSGGFDSSKFKGFNNWALFTGSPHFGFGVISTSDSEKSVEDWRYTLSFGSRSLAFGAGFGFTGGDKGYFKKSNLINLGILSRPSPFLSLGIFSTIALEKEEYEIVADLAIRPIPNYLLTIYGDFGMFNDERIKEGRWSGGVSWEFLDGIRLNGRYFSDKSFIAGFDVSLGSMGISGIAGFDNSSDMNFNTYSFRLGALDRSYISELFTGTKKFAKLDLSGFIKYQKYLFFDNSLTLRNILEEIERLKNDESIEGLLVNATNLWANREMLWELREKLAEFKAMGKKVVIFIERANIDKYHFASVADKVVIDPLGIISLEGYRIGRSYYKQLLANVGIGFEEIRLFKYKSAVESYSREGMSDADREQNKKLISDWYETTQLEVCNSRRIKPDEFDSLVNRTFIYMPELAKESGLIDTTGRWVDAEDITKKLYGEELNFKDAASHGKKPEPFDDKWGVPPNKIAIVYAVGVCAMDGAGIKARQLVKDLKAAIENKDIKAIILRIDSPGGDAMASDYIADVLRKNKGKKPVIVSQGYVAASGGYWLSMDADAIVAAPMTITGSIGVIAGYMYDKGMKDSMGISTDLVKIGKYADLGFAYTLPILPLGLPIRNITADEKLKLEAAIMNMYKDFVSKAASGRKKNYDDIEKISQGRIWSGSEGKKIGLVDEIGGLDKAIKLAKEKAGIEPDEDYTLVEYPVLGWFDFSSLFSKFLGFNIEKEDIMIENLKFLMKNNTMPMPVIPLDYMEKESNVQF